MRILVVDDHAVVLDGVGRLLQSSLEADIDKATSGELALAAIEKDRPDIVLLDLNLGGMGGLEFIQQVTRQPAPPRILVLSMHTEPAYVSQALKAGAWGYVSKAADAEIVLEGVKAVLAGSRYVEEDLRTKLSELDTDNPLEKLTVRELEILRLLGRGESLTSIASSLGIAYKTVANTCTQMKNKLGLERTADLIRIALGNQTISKK